VQRAGGEGFSHNEINPDDISNRMIQLWVLPEQKGERAAYQYYQPLPGKVTRVYGGSINQNDTLASHTIIEIVSLSPAQEFIIKMPFLAYLTVGNGTANNLDIKDGDLIKDDQLIFIAKSDVHLIVIYET
jgi:redox-sensitive bicupin YhaK (pirin superfamily)